MAMLQFEPPLWVALPAQDKRFAEAASVAREGVVLDLAVESESVFSPSLLASFPPGSVFIDVGADIGLFALQLAAFTWYRIAFYCCLALISCHSPATDVTSLNGKPCQPGEGRFTVVAFEPRQESAQHMRSAAARNCFTNMVLRSKSISILIEAIDHVNDCSVVA